MKGTTPRSLSLSSQAALVISSSVVVLILSWWPQNISLVQTFPLNFTELNWLSIQPKCLTGISNLTMSKTELLIRFPNLLLSQSYIHTTLVDGNSIFLTTQTKKTWNHPGLLSHMPYLIYQQIVLVYSSMYIQNSIISHHLLVTTFTSHQQLSSRLLTSLQVSCFFCSPLQRGWSFWSWKQTMSHFCWKLWAKSLQWLYKALWNLHPTLTQVTIHCSFFIPF